LVYLLVAVLTMLYVVSDELWNEPTAFVKEKIIIIQLSLSTY